MDDAISPNTEAEKAPEARLSDLVRDNSGALAKTVYDSLKSANQNLTYTESALRGAATIGIDSNEKLLLAGGVLTSAGIGAAIKYRAPLAQSLKIAPRYAAGAWGAAKLGLSDLPDLYASETQTIEQNMELPQQLMQLCLAVRF
ncbi:MAG: hypothetical protein K2W82_07345 [Candidatus Obscuribacterales bacterium]|nr:hypothetical protein [Candidatus Obscuribacterales bacterium]